MTNNQAREPPLVGSPRLLIQYICTYPPYLEAISSSATRGCAIDNKKKSLHDVLEAHAEKTKHTCMLLPRPPEWSAKS
jgi:hypothetical protein